MLAHIINFSSQSQAYRTKALLCISGCCLGMALVWRSLKLTGGDGSWESHFKNFFIPFYPFLFLSHFLVSFIALSLTAVLQDCRILTPPPHHHHTNRLKGVPTSQTFPPTPSEPTSCLVPA
jgi:hypothetical protein